MYTVHMLALNHAERREEINYSDYLLSDLKREIDSCALASEDVFSSWLYIVIQFLIITIILFSI